MSNHPIDVANLKLDELGRVVLPEDFLSKIEHCENYLTAGGNDYCPGTINNNCSNGECVGSSNKSWCTNVTYCLGATNVHFCFDGPI